MDLRSTGLLLLLRLTAHAADVTKEAVREITVAALTMTLRGLQVNSTIFNELLDEFASVTTSNHRQTEIMQSTIREQMIAIGGQIGGHRFQSFIGHRIGEVTYRYLFTGVVY
eukprot:6799306-Pyramimonas_sp.AAC.1